MGGAGGINKDWEPGSGCSSSVRQCSLRERRDLTFDTGLGVWIKSKEIPGFLSGASRGLEFTSLLWSIRLAIYITLDFYKISYIPVPQAQDSRKSFCGYAAAEGGVDWLWLETVTATSATGVPPQFV